jgi:hypothetical protein
MRIMAGSACKPNASQTRLENQGIANERQNRRIPFVQSGLKLHAIEALNRCAFVI